jgi:ABC-type antimicrobial peptide transport system permease subunit
MKPNSLKIALRYFRAADRYSLLNIFGLTIGISLFVLMVMLLHYELSYDAFHTNKKKILQVCEHDLKSGEYMAYSAMPLPLTLKNDFPEVKYVTGIWGALRENAKLKYQDTEYTGFTGASAEPDIFNIFNYRLILGDIHTVLNDPDKIAVSKSLAAKIFGNENPIGKVISFYNFTFTISHVFSDLPQNSSVHFDVLFSDKIREKIDPDYKVAWWNSGMLTYVILQDGYSTDSFNSHLKEIPSRYYPDFLKGRSTYFTAPFYKSHFNTLLIGQPAVSYTYIILLGCISFIILLIACVNYINLTLARAFKMNIDAGIRRIVGASSQHIISLQIWLSLLNVFVALLLAMPLSSLCLPLFEKLAERQLAGQENNIYVWMFTIGISFFVAILSGIIPGVSFSKVIPARIIKTKNSFIRINQGVHNGLLVFQFSLTITLIIVQFFIVRQIAFMKSANLGYNNENLLAVNLGNIQMNRVDKFNKAKVYNNEMEKQGAGYGLSTGSITEDIPGFYFENSFTVNPVDASIEECLVKSTAVDENFTRVFGVDVVAGRFFSDQYSTDNEAFIINETAMKQFGWKNIDGKFLKLSFEDSKCPVVGVMKDIHPTTLKEPIPPMIYRYGLKNNFPAFITFRILPLYEKQTIALMKKNWETIFPDTPFIYLNVRETYYKNYVEEQRLSKIIGIFALLAISLSLLGLFGLITFYTERRIKEIGIRKINGARVSEILMMLNKDFLKWIAIAFLIACCFAWLAVYKWLQSFAYKTTISWWIFAMAGLIVSGIALLTISWQSWRAATRNPVEALRYE